MHLGFFSPVLASMLFLFCTILSSCLPGGRREEAARDDSILTSIEGIEEKDRQREGTEYALVCNAGGRIIGAPQKIGAEDFIVFNAANVKDGDQCAMTVAAKVANPNLFEWLGHKNDGSKAVGLFYGSKKATVTSRKLKLDLIKLYREQIQDPFKITVAVQFDLGSGSNAGVMPTDALKTGTNIICSQKKNYPGTFEKTGDLTATLSFQLSVSELKGQVCESVMIVDLEKKVDTFTGRISGANFTSVEQGKTYELGKPDAFILKPTVIAGGQILVSGSVSESCLRGLNVDTNACLDRTSVTLPFAANYIVAKVKGRNKQKAEVTYFVSAGDGGFGRFEGQSLTVEMINKTIAATATEAEKKMFSFWNASVEGSLFSTPFEKEFVAGKTLTSHLASRDSLVAAVTFMDIDTIWVHGFQPLSVGDLNRNEAARWLAVVTAKKSGQADQKFIVAGYERFFTSANAPAGTREQRQYFDMAQLATEMASSDGTIKWRVYALKDGSMAPSSCQVDQDYYVKTLSQYSNEAVRIGGGEDSKIDACEVTRSAFNSSKFGTIDSGYTIEPTFYLWGWHRLR